MKFVVLLIFLALFNELAIARNATPKITWDSFMSKAKSTTRSLVRSSMPFFFETLSLANASSECGRALMTYGMGLMKWKPWAIRMLDATAKIPSGILEGTLMDFGAFEECLEIRVNESSKRLEGKEFFRGRYCTIGLQSLLVSSLSEMKKDEEKYIDVYGRPPDLVYDIISKTKKEFQNATFWFGMCVPSSCSENDLQKISAVISEPYDLKVSIADCQIEEPFIWPAYALASVSVLSCLAGFCGLGTLLDVILRWQKSNPTSQGDEYLLLRILKMFSVLTNTEKLLSGKSKEVGCLEGIRIFSAAWIVLGHTYFSQTIWRYYRYRRLLGFFENFNKHFTAAVIENCSLAVTSFFFISGFLLVHSEWKRLEKSNGKLNIFMFIVHKYWRMTPALGFSIALFLSMTITDSGPLWHVVWNPLIKDCQDRWWLNFLYVNNWKSLFHQCQPVSWYLAALMQIHILGIVLLLVFYRYRKCGLLLGCLITVSCVSTTAFIIIWRRYPVFLLVQFEDMKTLENFMKELYIQAYHHIPSYLVGMVTAYYFLNHHNQKIILKYQILCWCLAATVGGLCLYGAYGANSNIVANAMYSSTFRIGWASSLGWMTYACASGYGGILNRFLSSKILQILGQMSFFIYLLHPLVLLYTDASSKERMYSGHSELVFSFLSTLVVTLFLSYVGHVAVEIPFSQLEKMILRNRTKLSPQNAEGKVNASSLKDEVPNP